MLQISCNEDGEADHHCSVTSMSDRWPSSYPFPKPGSAEGRRLSAALVILDSLAAVVCLAIIGYTLVNQRPISGASALLVIAIPLLAVGQIWAIVVVRARQSAADRESRKAWTLRFFAGHTPRPIVIGVYILGFCGWLAGMLAIIHIFPAPPGVLRTPSTPCPYPYNDHGTVLCLTKSVSQKTAADLQRFTTGVLMGFFSTHILASCGDLYDNRGQRQT